MSSFLIYFEIVPIETAWVEVNLKTKKIPIVFCKLINLSEKSRWNEKKRRAKREEKKQKKENSSRRIGRRQMKKEKRNRGLSSWNEKVALGLRKKTTSF